MYERVQGNDMYNAGGNAPFSGTSSFNNVLLANPHTGTTFYVAEGEPRLKAQCHCRECQYISGGAPNMFMLMAPEGFRYTSGEPRKFTRSDLESPVTREFCGECGTHLTTRRPGLPLVILKVGTLDNPDLFGTPQMAIYTVDRQPFHVIPDGLQTFERLPPR